MKAYILALNGEPRNPDLIPSLVFAGVNFCIISGTTIENTKKYMRGINSPKRSGDRLNDYERACAYGHLKMQIEAYSQGDDYNLFLEDDAVLEKNSFEKILGAVNQLPKGITLLGVCGGLAYRRPFNLELGLFKLVENMFNGSHAYIADRVTIREVMKSSWDLPNYADRFPRPRSIKMFVVYPFAAFQMKENSPDISREAGIDSRGRLRKSLGLAFHDLMDLHTSHFLSGRTLGFLLSHFRLRNFFLRLPGCRD